MASKTGRKNKRGKDGVVCGPNATISEINANGRCRWRVLIREEQPGGRRRRVSSSHADRLGHRPQSFGGWGPLANHGGGMASGRRTAEG